MTHILVILIGDYFLNYSLDFLLFHNLWTRQKIFLFSFFTTKFSDFITYFRNLFLNINFYNQFYKFTLLELFLLLCCNFCFDSNASLFSPHGFKDYALAGLLVTYCWDSLHSCSLFAQIDRLGQFVGDKSPSLKSLRPFCHFFRFAQRRLTPGLLVASLLNSL